MIGVAEKPREERLYTSFAAPDGARRLPGQAARPLDYQALTQHFFHNFLMCAFTYRRGPL
jgi:hypothetical protein